MRNKTAFIFVLLANLVLLAHAVIPHHHHTEAPIEIAVECSHEHEHEHHEKIPFCNGEHENGETAPCVLAEAIIVPNNQIRLSELLELTITNLTLFFTLYVFNFATPREYVGTTNGALECIPLHSRFLISSQGLRAPPAC